MIGLEWEKEGGAGDRFLEGDEGGAVKAGGGGEEECVIGIVEREAWEAEDEGRGICGGETVSYTHLRAHETVLDLVCRLLLRSVCLLYTSDAADE